MKKKYITPTSHVVVLRYRSHLLDYSVEALKNSTDPSKAGDDKDWEEN